MLDGEIVAGYGDEGSEKQEVGTVILCKVGVVLTMLLLFGEVLLLWEVAEEDREKFLMREGI